MLFSIAKVSVAILVDLVMERRFQKEQKYLSAAIDLVLASTFFRKGISELTTYNTGEYPKQVITSYSSEMKNASHNTNYLLMCWKFKLRQKSHVLYT